MGIVKAPKLYLDTNHLIEIARIRKGDPVRIGAKSAYSLIDDCIRNRHFDLVFSQAAPLDWIDGNATLDSALELAAVVDSAQLQYEFEKDSFVFLHEIQAELRRLSPDIRLPQFEILLLPTNTAAKRALAILKNDVPRFFEEGELTHEEIELPYEIPFFSAADWVKRYYELKHDDPDTYRERIKGHRAAVTKDLEIFGQRGDKCITQADRTAWMKRFVRVDHVIAAMNPQTDVDDLLEHVDLANCPAASLYLKAHEQRLRAGTAPKDNDADDWMIVHVVPYVDLVLTERNLSHFIRQADPSVEEKVTHDPNEAVRLL